jgi:hypothetical protein
VKYAKTNTLQTQQAIARFGKSARHPLCLAALDLWRLDEELSAPKKMIVRDWELVKSLEQRRQEAIWLIEQFNKQRKQIEASQASATLRKVDKLLPEAQKRFRQNAKLLLKCERYRDVVAAEFERERVATKGDTKAHKALQRVRKRWNNRKAFAGDTDRRTLEILKMLRVKASDKAKDKYLEAAQSGGRALSDKAWKKLLTAREIQSRLEDAPGDRDAKEVRRLAKKLGIRLARDKRGRRRKPPLSRQKNKRPRGLPRTTPWEEFIRGTALAESELSSGGPQDRKLPRDQFWDSTEARRTAAQKQSAKLKDKARKTTASTGLD